MKKNNNNLSNKNIPLTIVLGLIPALTLLLIFLEDETYFILPIILCVTILYWLFKYNNGVLKIAMVILNIIVGILSVILFINDYDLSRERVRVPCYNAICTKCVTKGKKTICSGCENPATGEKRRRDCIYSNN